MCSDYPLEENSIKNTATLKEDITQNKKNLKWEMEQIYLE